MRIGELAKKTDCHVETIRYYHKQGLLLQPIKLPNGYGEYTEKHLAHLRLIRRTRGLGFSPESVRELIRLAEMSESPCDEVISMTETQLDDIAQKIADLESIQDALNTLLGSCKRKDSSACPALTELLS